ncbi:MAG: hypothetical protein Q4C54_06540 [Clostridia bacterium]|nr:hypothetical protein [Clostridia bacterium]
MSDPRYPNPNFPDRRLWRYEPADKRYLKGYCRQALVLTIEFSLPMLVLLLYFSWNCLEDLPIVLLTLLPCFALVSLIMLPFWLPARLKPRPYEVYTDTHTFTVSNAPPVKGGSWKWYSSVGSLRRQREDNAIVIRFRWGFVFIRYYMYASDEEYEELWQYMMSKCTKAKVYE